MKKLILCSFLISIFNLAAFLNGSDSSREGRKAYAQGDISPDFIPSPFCLSPRREESKRAFQIDLSPELNELTISSLNNELDKSELSCTMAMSPSCQKKLLKAHVKNKNYPTSPFIKQEKPTLNQLRLLDCVEISLISSAAAGACYATYKQSGVILNAHNFFQPQKRFIPGMESAAIGSAQLLYAGVSSATALIALSAIAYKINRMVHASCRYKLENQNRDFAQQVEKLSEDFQAYQVATDHIFNTLLEKITKADKSHRRLAMQTQEGFILQSQHIDSANKASVSTYEALRILAETQQPRAASLSINSSPVPSLSTSLLSGQLTTALNQAQSAVNQIAQEHSKRATPVIDISQEITPIAPIQSIPIKPKKIKSGGCCC
ncbi:MAG: hypothetical protein NTU89_02205 [Candidatus Dependentiae bacterium]|nr:hypothetical protein [Candidatus Dependentiae bacterium]